MSAEIKPQRRWLRYSLATFLFVSLCIGGLLAGYQSGHRRGYKNGANQRYNETQVTETYCTLVVVWPDLPAADRKAAVESLKSLITSTIAPDVWRNGTGNEIRFFPQNQSLIVTAPGWVQVEVRDLFSQLEKLKIHGMADQLLPSLQSMASEGKTQQHSIPVNAPKNSQAAGMWIGKYFDATIQGVSKHWGRPYYSRNCTDPGFPNWSLDQRITTWKRDNGLSYLALRTGVDGNLHIVAGWHGDS